MKIIPASYEFITPMGAEAYSTIIKRLELIGRVCYKSEDKITEDSAEKFIRMLIKRGHESVLEHCAFTVRFIVDRGVSHELVRHRMASFSQESSRYVRYEDVEFIDPCFLNDPNPFEEKRFQWQAAMKWAENAYQGLLKNGATPQEARSVLPNSLKTEVVMTANIREWRHVFKLRCASGAHPQMREVMIPLLEECKAVMPALFEDLEV